VDYPIHTRFIWQSSLVTGNLAAVNLCDTSGHLSLPDFRQRFSRLPRHRLTPAGVIMATTATAATTGAVAITVGARASSVALWWVH
jgi:hypothetical protein